jgi:hypothetical protein
MIRIINIDSVAANDRFIRAEIPVLGRVHHDHGNSIQFNCGSQLRNILLVGAKIAVKWSYTQFLDLVES